jgi:precorrin-3B methylase
MTGIKSIREVVEQSSGDAEALIAALEARENDMADVLRLNAVQFSLFPEIVAEVLAAVEMGGPMTTEQRAMIHSNFHIRMERLNRGDFTL